MGLTIHYELKEPSRVGGRARRRVEELREHAATLPFKLVGQVLEAGCTEINNSGGDDPRRGLFTQATRYVRSGAVSVPVTPNRLVAFSTSPGDGCEEANFGLAVYPRSVEVNGRSIRTGLSGWSWSSFCKTQYAANVGGVANFLRCHLAIVALLDFARILGVLGRVHDEGDYWDTRDHDMLTRHVSVTAHAC